MALSLERSEIEIVGLRRRGPVQGAVLVLAGAKKRELRRAAGLAALFADRCLLIAVDGGLRTCRYARRRPDLFVGDVDSTSNIPASLPSVVYPRDKDFSDLAGALREARRRGARIAVIAGMLGGRLDHEWANLMEVGARAKGFAGVLAPTERGTVLVTSRGCRAATPRNRTVSVFALGGSAVVTLRGTRWGLRRHTLRPGSVGLSNKTSGALALTVHRGTVAVVFPEIS